jgi:4-amino-4-deoxy-L-arabinose transferase-like glycosyltransferase
MRKQCLDEVDWIPTRFRSERVRWTIVGGLAAALLLIVFQSGHSEWAIRVGMVGIALLACAFPTRKAIQRVVAACLLGLTIIVIFYRLGAGSLYDWDEAIYAVVAKEMVLSDDWADPTFGGDPYMQKPPLYFWLTALTYQIAGINEFSARFGSALSGLTVVALTMFFGARMFSWGAGIAAALLLLVVDHTYLSHWYNFISQARVGMLETTLTLWVLLSFILAWESTARPKLILGLGITAGLAFMTKSWSGSLAFTVPLFYALITGQFRQQRTYWLGAVLIASAIILPWHLLQLWLHGTAFLHEYFVVNVLGRVFTLVEQTSRGPLFYLTVIQQGFPYFAYLCGLAYLYNIRTVRRKHTRQKMLLLLWISVPLLLFSLAATKLGWYVMLTYPGIALVAGSTLTAFMGDRLAVAAVATAMALSSFRLPADSDGSPDARTFAIEVNRIRTPGLPIFVYSEKDCRAGETLGQYVHSSGMLNIVPSLIYYLDRPVACTNTKPQGPGEAPRYLVTDTWTSSSEEPATVLLRRGRFLLSTG